MSSLTVTNTTQAAMATTNILKFNLTLPSVKPKNLHTSQTVYWKGVTVLHPKPRCKTVPSLLRNPHLVKRFLALAKVAHLNFNSTLISFK